MDYKGDNFSERSEQLETTNYITLEKLRASTRNQKILFNRSSDCSDLTKLQMGNFLGVKVKVPVDNEVADGAAQIVGWGNTVQKAGDIDELNKAYATSSSVGNLNVFPPGTRIERTMDHSTEKALLKMGLGVIIFIQAILLFITCVGWSVAYKNAKRDFRRVKQLEYELQEARRVPHIANTVFHHDPTIDNTRRPRLWVPE
jgi:hypothetical protein